MRFQSFLKIAALAVCTSILVGCSDVQFASPMTASSATGDLAADPTDPNDPSNPNPNNPNNPGNPNDPNNPSNPADPLNCELNGQFIPNGSSIEAFAEGQANPAGSCVSEMRTCTNGVLSGSFMHLSCSYSPLQNCTFNGQTIAHGQSLQAYLNSTEAFGGSCQVETRVCNNGTLSGSYMYSNCIVGQAQSCLFNGMTVASGQSVTAYQASGVAFGSGCRSESRTCTNGVLSGSYAYGNCAVGQATSCLFNGQTIAHGQSVTAYPASTVAYGQSCNGEQRTCTNGALSGSATFGSCVVGQPAGCLFNGQTIAHGQSVTAFAASNVGYGQACSSQQRTCNNGNLSGANQFASCTTGQPQSCLFNGQTIAHGQSITNFYEPNPAFGVGCSPEVRTCGNGTLSGSYAFQSCTQKACAPYSAQSCGDISNGSHLQWCNAEGTGWGSCIQTCNDGFVMMDGQCVQKVNECPANEVRSCTYNLSLGDMGGTLLAYRQSCREDGRWHPESSVFAQWYLTDCAGSWAGPYGNSQWVGLRDNGTPLPSSW